MPTDAEARGLLPYVARLHAEWHAATPEQNHRRVPGTLVFADISGFTALTERLARKGKVGSEEMSDALNAVFSDILTPAHDEGGDLVKWGGDAVLLLFSGVDHAARACRAAFRMRARLRDFGALGTTSGSVRLRMSQGVHSGEFDFYLVGDPALHRELLVSGPEVSQCVRLEGHANAGEIAISHRTLSEIGRAYAGKRVEDEGVLLKGCPAAARPELLSTLAPTDLRPLLPTEIRAHLLRGDADPEHRDIAVGFVKFTGTDRLATEEGPAAVAAALDEVIRNVSSATDEFGVTFFETDLDADGGKVMLAAGVPISAGHHAERMLRATRLMLDRAGRLPLKIGVNYGHVFAGDFGPEFRRTYSIKGDPINLAARVMGKASPGTLLATQTAIEKSETVFETEALEPFMVKGKTQPVQALKVGQVLATPRDRRSHASLLVGRSAELEQLEAALDRLEWSRGQAIEILGPPGIGKSRLLTEAMRMAGDQTVHFVQCVEYDASTPYHLFWVLLHNVLKLTVGAPNEDAVARFAAHVKSAAPDLMQWFPLLCVPLDYDVADTSATRGMDEELKRHKTEEVVSELLYRLLSGETMLVFDDVQYLDSASAGVLDRVVAGLGERPMLVVLGRHEVEHGWRPAEGAEVATIKLEPLSASESLRMVVAAQGDQPLPPRLAEQLAAKAGGNPLFLQSLLHEADPTGDVADLPGSIAELVTVQIDRLPPYERTILRRASVLGSGFDLEQLPLVFDDPPDDATLERLDDFLQIERSRRWASFRHAMMRDVAYEGLPYKARRELHGRIGAALERAGGTAGSRPELLSLHFFHAHDFEKAWAYARNAGDQAMHQYAYSEAVDQYNRAIESARKLPDALVPRAALGHTYESLGDCWFTIGLVDPATTAYRRAARLALADAVHSAEIAFKLASVEHRLRRFPQSLARLTRGISRLEATAGAKAHAARSRLFTGYARTRWSQGRLGDAITWQTRALEEARSSDDVDVLATGYGNLHVFYVMAGQSAPELYGRMALDLYNEVGDLSGQAHTSNNLGLEAQQEHRWVEAGEMYSDAASMFTTLGDTDKEAEATYNVAEVLVDQGRYAEALPHLDHALMSARSVSDEELAAYTLRLIGRALSASGNVTGGLTMLDEAREIFLRIEQQNEVEDVDRWRAVAMLLDGDERSSLELTDGLLDACHDDAAEASLRWIRGFAFLERDDLTSAEREFTAGREYALVNDRPYDVALCALGLARCGNQGAQAWETGANQTLESLGVAGLPVPPPRRRRAT
ncbi:MAG TPA: adenylate/guanylate cyclase domain-containing protein [Nocardioidaceae bacterium]|nr:adenylate/guanylate cyclase domain-containing protein [Nocardioidaceae bacterium]